MVEQRQFRAGAMLRTLAQSGSGFTKGWLGVQPENKRTSAIEPEYGPRPVTVESSQSHRAKTNEVIQRDHPTKTNEAPPLRRRTYAKNSRKNPLDNQHSFRDSHPNHVSLPDLRGFVIAVGELSQQCGKYDEIAQ